MDTTEISKIAAGGLVIGSALALALAGKIDGHFAMQQITNIGMVYMGAAAAFGGMKKISDALKRP